MAKERDNSFERMNGKHDDAAKLHNVWNHAINSLIADYKAAGGKRDIDKFKADDK